MPAVSVRPLRALLRLGAAAAVVLGATVVVPGPVSATTDVCAPTPDLTSRAPFKHFAIAGGATATVWDTGTLADRLQERRLAVVRIPASTLTPAVLAARTVSMTARPSEMASIDPSAVVAINGGTFNATAHGVPDRVQIAKGRVRKLIKQSVSDGYFGGIVVDSASKTIHGAAYDIDGTFTAAGGSAPVGAVNWQWLASDGVSVYTNVWGSGSEHPAGPRTVVVKKGVVLRVLGSGATGRPALGEIWVTATAGTPAAALLDTVAVGQSVAVGWSALGTYRYAGTPAGSFTQPTGATGSGGAILKDGVNTSACTTRDEYLRARSVLAWDKDGNLMVVAVAGRSRHDGGLTVHQMADVLLKLGAVTAIRLDGGGSTALWVRKTVGGKLLRLDRPATEYELPVVDAVAFRAV